MWISCIELLWDDDSDDHFVFDKHRSGENVANSTRAVTEPMVASHFGDYIDDDLFKKYAEYVAEHLCLEKTKSINIVVSLSKK